MAAASAVVLPFVFLGTFSGHDFGFHLTSWMDVARQWQEGVWFPRWAAWANYGFGEPRFIFYPPISWLLGAALGCVLPWRMVPATLVWLALVIAGVSMLRLAREWLPSGKATLAAMIFTANPYYLLVIYYRSAYAELLAGAVFPLLVLYAVRLSRGEGRAISPLAVVFATVWLANAPAAVIALYALALLLALLATKNKSLRLVVSGGGAIALGMLLAAFYILPATWEQRWVTITQAISTPLGPNQNFLFTAVNDPERTLFNLQVSTLASVEIIATAVAALIFDRRGLRAREAWSVLVLLAVFSTVMMYPISSPLWRHLPKIAFVQFPWRWLTLLIVAFSIYCAGACSTVGRKWIPYVLILAPLGTVGWGAFINGDWEVEELPTLPLQKAIQTEYGYEGNEAYTPIGCHRHDLSHGAPEVSVEPSDTATARAHVLRWLPEQKVVEVDSQQPGTLALRLVDYPAWRAKVNGRTVPILARLGTAQMLLSVRAGHSLVEVRLAHTPDRILGAALSLFGAIVLGGLILAQRRGTATNERDPKGQN